MRAVFFGTPSFSLPSLRALLRDGIEVSLICTRPARRSGRGRVLQPTPVETAGEELGIPVIAPERLDSASVAEISKVDADVFVVVAYGRLIPAELLYMPRLRVVNLHPSLLPRHRGPSPVATAILKGDECTGVSVMLLDEGMDTGPLLALSEKVRICRDTWADELTDRLFSLGAEMLPGVLDGWSRGDINAEEQDESLATVTKLIRKSDGEVDWSASAGLIERMNRAYHPWPGTYTFWKGEILKLISVEVDGTVSGCDANGAGVVAVSDVGELTVWTGDGKSVLVKRLQMSGRKAVEGREFLRGYSSIVGARLGR